MKGLFLDDERNPEDVTWIKYPCEIVWDIVRTHAEFEKALIHNSYDFVSLDHDIQDFTEEYKELTGYTCLLTMINFVMDDGMSLPRLFVHSQNPVGAENIRQHYNNYLKFLEI